MRQFENIPANRGTHVCVCMYTCIFLLPVTDMFIMPHLQTFLTIVFTVTSISILIYDKSIPTKAFV